MRRMRMSGVRGSRIGIQGKTEHLAVFGQFEGAIADSMKLLLRCTGARLHVLVGRQSAMVKGLCRL